VLLAAIRPNNSCRIPMLVYGRPVRAILTSRSGHVQIPSCSSTDYPPGLDCNAALRLTFVCVIMLYYTLTLTLPLTHVSGAEQQVAALHPTGPSQ
jgi:hypothetical protein